MATLSLRQVFSTFVLLTVGARKAFGKMAPPIQILHAKVLKRTDLHDPYHVYHLTTRSLVKNPLKIKISDFVLWKIIDTRLLRLEIRMVQTKMCCKCKISTVFQRLSVKRNEKIPR